MKRAFLIAAPHSGSGKTTIARGLMALYRKKGQTVQPFKCGPDYIDTKFHQAVCGRPSINLDTFFADEEHLRSLFHRYAQDADVAIVEGMMGLFDGYDRDRGSSAEIARILGLPILLVVDARSAAYSMAALLQGFIHFRPGLAYAGVLFNKVGSERHAQMLREVAREVGIPCLGCLPKRPELETASRYLGLDFSEQAASDELVRLLEEHVDWQQIIGHTPQSLRDSSPILGEQLNYISEGCMATSSPSKIEGVPEGRGRMPNIVFGWRGFEIPDSKFLDKPSGKAERRISNPQQQGTLGAGPTLVARNAESFSFLYQETLDRLAQMGSVEFFDPEEDPPLPSLKGRGKASPFKGEVGEGLSPSLGGGRGRLYLPGGYPEKHLEALVQAEDTRNAIRKFAEQGGRIVAECGGMMYLCQSIVTDEGEYPMCGVLPYRISARKQDRRLSLGYRRFVMDGREYRGHEFHYTQVLGGTWETSNPEIRLIPVLNAKGEPVPTPVIRYKNVVASYTHVYDWLS